MATNKVAMGMTVLKWMKEGVIRSVRPADRQALSGCKSELFSDSLCVVVDFQTSLRCLVTEDVFMLLNYGSKASSFLEHGE